MDIAVPEGGLVPAAVNHNQVDGAIPFAEAGAGSIGAGGRAAAQLLAYHLGVLHVPAVVRHRAPASLQLHLHPPGARTPTADQPQLHRLCTGAPARPQPRWGMPRHMAGVPARPPLPSPAQVTPTSQLWPQKC